MTSQTHHTCAGSTGLPERDVSVKEIAGSKAMFSLSKFLPYEDMGVSSRRIFNMIPLSTSFGPATADLPEE
jgi:hypothetical protein